MSEHVSLHVRAIFSELGIPHAESEAAGGLVIDRFEQWTNPAGGQARYCATTGSRIDDAWLDAA